MGNLAESQNTALDGNQIVAANIRSELGYADIGQGDLAAAIEMSDMAMSRRMSAKYAAEFSAGEIARIADVFGIEPGELFKTRDRSPRPGAGAGRRGIYLLEEPNLRTLVPKVAGSIPVGGTIVALPTRAKVSVERASDALITPISRAARVS